MSTPDNDIFKNNDDNDNPRNISNDQENFETIETDLSGNDLDDDAEASGDNQADTAKWEQATTASEPSFTLDVERGITPEPDEKTNDGYGDTNIKP